MRLDAARQETISNLNGSQKFRMNASAKAFQILSSGIYERKIEAIVRELSCNAYDSHVQAGKSDVAFYVKLPTPIDPLFYVEDYGVGLSEEEVYNVYTTYFESTKTDSNDVIGALGLGSKTPFSYTDSFNVTARKDGVERVFNASIGETGEPEIVKMFERPYAGDNGVKVEVTVNEKDCHEFLSCAEKVFSWFRVKPESNKDYSCDYDQEAIDSVEQYGYYLKAGSTYGWNPSDCKVIMGNVAYDIDITELKNSPDCTDDLSSFIEQIKMQRAAFFFSVAIGDADVAASRETLSLDDRTKTNLLKRLEGICETFASSVKSRMGGFKNVFEAQKSLTPFERSFVRDVPVNGYTLGELAKSRYLGVASDRLDDGEIDTLNEYSFTFYGMFGSGRGRKFKNNSTAFVSDAVGPNNTVTVVVNDCERQQGLKGAIQDESSLPEYVFTIITKKTKVTKELENILDKLFFGGYEIVYASTFWDGKLTKNVSRGTGLDKKSVKAMRVASGCYGIGVVDFNVEDPAKWAILPYENGLFRMGGRYITSMNIRRMREELGLDGIIGYNKTNERKVKRIISNDLSDLFDKVDVAKDIVNLSLKQSFSENSSPTLRLFEDYEKMEEAVGELVVNMPTVARLKAAKAFPQTLWVNAGKQMETRVDVFKKRMKMLCKKSKVLAASLTSYRFDETMLPELREYVEFINSRKEK